MEVRKLDIYDEHLVNGTEFCVAKCPLNDFSCFNVCISAEKYCDGVVDLASNDTIFVSQTDNSTFLLYPDELYCSHRFHALFMISYVLSFVSFSFGVALIVRTRPLVHFLIRRRAKEVLKKKENQA